MSKVTITIEYTPEKGLCFDSTFHPVRGQPLDLAEMAALEIMLYKNKEWGIRAALAKAEPSAAAMRGVDIDTVHRLRGNVVGAAR